MAEGTAGFEPPDSLDFIRDTVMPSVNAALRSSGYVSNEVGSRVISGNRGRATVCGYYEDYKVEKGVPLWVSHLLVILMQHPYRIKLTVHHSTGALFTCSWNSDEDRGIKKILVGAQQFVNRRRYGDYSFEVEIAG